MMKHYDLASSSLRELNQALHDPQMTASEREWRVSNSNGAHNIACGLNEQISVEIDGHAGYYCAGMNQKAHVTVNGNVGVGVAENMMSGKVHVKGDASQSAGATAHGGLLVIEGNIGPMSAFMGQAGRLVVCGDAGEALGDSLYEVHIYVKGEVASLGADCVAKEMRQEHLDELADLLKQAGSDENPGDFTRYGSARQLYHFKVTNASAY